MEDRNTEWLSDELGSLMDDETDSLDGHEPLEREVTRVLMEDSPRLAPAVQIRQAGELRARAMRKRAERRRGWNGFLTGAPRWAQLAAIALVTVLFANGLSVASASSLPGSPLYPVKRAAEQGSVLLAPSAGDRARLWMSLASARLDEAQRLESTEGRVDSATLVAVDQSILAALSEIAGTRGAERVALLQALTELTVRQQAVLNQLSTDASPTDRLHLEQTSRLLNGVATIAVSEPPDESGDTEEPTRISPRLPSSRGSGGGGAPGVAPGTATPGPSGEDGSEWVPVQSTPSNPTGGENAPAPNPQPTQKSPGGEDGGQKSGGGDGGGD